MATADFTALPPVSVCTGPRRQETKPTTNVRPRQMHRVRTVRLQQGVSLRSAARATGVDIRQLRLQEQESTDLRLSDLQRWRKALDVPLSELLVEPESGLSQPILERAKLVRLMKTAAAIVENAPTPAMERMGQTLVDQLTDFMPELKDVGAWHSYGQRRSLDEYGRVAEQVVSMDTMPSMDLGD